MIADFTLEKMLSSKTMYRIDLDRFLNIIESSKKIADTYSVDIDEIAHLRNSLEDLLRKYPKDHYTIKEIFEFNRRVASTECAISVIILSIVVGCLVEYDSKQ